VDADGVEAALRRELQLVHVLVVDFVGARRIEQLGVDVDPDAIVLLHEVRRQIRIRHQMKPAKSHRDLSVGSAPASRALSPVGRGVLYALDILGWVRGVVGMTPHSYLAAETLRLT